MLLLTYILLLWKDDKFLHSDKSVDIISTLFKTRLHNPFTHAFSHCVAFSALRCVFRIALRLPYLRWIIYIHGNKHFTCTSKTQCNVENARVNGCGNSALGWLNVLFLHDINRDRSRHTTELYLTINDLIFTFSLESLYASVVVVYGPFLRGLS